MISWQRRDVNLPPDPILKLMAVASCCSLYIISLSTERSRRKVRRRFAILNQQFGEDPYLPCGMLTGGRMTYAAAGGGG